MNQSAGLLDTSHSLSVNISLTKLIKFDSHACFLQVAIFNTELSVENFKAAMSIPAALGLDPAVANSGATFCSSIMEVTFSYFLVKVNTDTVAVALKLLCNVKYIVTFALSCSDIVYPLHLFGSASGYQQKLRICHSKKFTKDSSGRIVFHWSGTGL
jgi:hypothetical protein